ncbi:glycosyltransferase family 4 protein [Treponema primitia]|uniref:glycosyltransferase family 4 protein n=1 Tax=Treponema primitia TaxID=88058 RepID=UPI00025556A0|nr:glycosyltransferase [Treponema primitia]
MNILGIYLLNQIRTGGNRRYLELMEALAERGNRVFVIINSFLDYTPRYFTVVKIPIKYIRHRFPPASYLFKKNVKKNIASIKKELNVNNFFPIDFIQIFGDTHLKVALYLRMELRLPLFYGFRCNDIDRAHILRASGGMSLKEYLFSLLYEPINRFREKQVARYAERISFQNSADMKRFVQRTRCPELKTVVIPGNIGLPRCTLEYENKNTSSQVKNILYVGSLSASKGLWDLLKALSILKNKGYDFLHCRILGRLENIDPTENLIKKLNIEELISIDGFKDPFPYLINSDLMVYPTLYDAFPNTVLESLHSGCPVIASEVGGVPDLLHYPELLFESGNILQIADRIERCIKDTSFYMHIRKLCGERAAVHHFDWAEQFENTMRACK